MQTKKARMTELLDSLYEETCHRALAKTKSSQETHRKNVSEIRSEIMRVALAPEGRF